MSTTSLSDTVSTTTRARTSSGERNKEGDSSVLHNHVHDEHGTSTTILRRCIQQQKNDRASRGAPQSYRGWGVGLKA